jgi:hypothetical protein
MVMLLLLLLMMMMMMTTTRRVLSLPLFPSWRSWITEKAVKY